MAMSNGSRINTNIQALNAYNALNSVSQQIGVHQLRLATGKRINSVGDDASGYTIAKQMEARSGVYSAALNNVGDAKSLLSTAEGALQTVRDLIIQSQEKIAGANNPAADKQAIANDVSQLGTEINDIIANTNFNGTKLFTSSFNQAFQVGYTSTENVSVTFNASALNATTTLTGVTSATIAATDINTMASTAENALQSIGSLMQRLDVKETNLNTAITNIDASKSRIMDADVALEQVNVTKLNILQQMGVAQLSQANSSPQQFLQLFK
jgi:flagellin